MEGFDYLEMQDLGEKYPEYNNMELDDLDNAYDRLSRERATLLRDEDPNRLDEVKERLNYIGDLQKIKFSETTFASNDKKTVTIKRKTQRSSSAPEVQYTNPEVSLSIDLRMQSRISFKEIIKRILNLMKIMTEQLNYDLILLVQQIIT